MAHLINPTRADLHYAVVDMDGKPLSWHRTKRTAQTAIDREWRAFRRRYLVDGSRGNGRAYLPRSIINCYGRAVYIERRGSHSTSWA